VSEEARAAEHRAQAARRKQFRASMCARLTGSATAKAALEAAWQPVLNEQRDRRVTPLDPEDFATDCDRLVGNGRID